MNTQPKKWSKRVGTPQWWGEFIAIVLMIWLALLLIVIGSIKILGWTVY